MLLGCLRFAVRALGGHPVPSQLFMLFLRNAGFYSARTICSFYAVPVGSAEGGERPLQLSPGCCCHQDILYSSH